MRHTLFAGLTQLDPTDPLSSDDYSFQAVNPDIIDRLLEVGARTHRHDAHAALGNPTTALTGTSFDSGGSIPGDTSIEFAYTLTDGYRGESAPSTIISVTTPPGLAEANVPPGASANYTGGSLRSDVYYYGRSWRDGAGGETEIGAVVAVDVDPFASAQVFLDGLNTGIPAGAAGWRLYRSRGGEDFRKLADGPPGQSTLTDDGSLCADCTEQPVESDTTASRARIEVAVPALPAGAASWSLYGRIVSGRWDTFSLLATGSAAQTVVLTSFSPDFGRPPSTSLTIAGAQKIDPDTELLDWHWKRPVSASAGLGSGALGDVKLVTGNGDLWAVLASGGTLGASGWTHIASGAGGGGSIQEVAASGDGRSVNPTKIKFRGSGSIGVTVTDVGGSAVVTLDDGGLVYETFASAGYSPLYTDNWSVDDRSAYTYTLGTAANLINTGGGVRLTADTTNVEMYYPSAASDGHCRVGAKIPDGNHDHHLILVSADTPALQLHVEYVPGGTTTITAWDGSTTQTVATKTGTPAAAEGWLYLYRSGNTVWAEFFTALGGAPAFKLSGTLDAAHAAVLGLGKSLRPGWKFFRMLDVGDLYDDFTFDLFGATGRMTRVRSGSADRKLLGENYATDYGIRIQEADGSPTIPDSHHLEFGAGSGSVGMRVIDLGGGSARVEVGGTSGGAGTGLISLSGSAGVTPVFDKHHIEFRASGAASVAIQDMGNGSAAVLISASGVPGVQGPQGSAGAQGITGPQGTPGSGAVVERRFNASAQVFGLASGASAITSLNLGAPNGRALRLTANQSNRIRLYAASAYRDADAGRGIGTDPSGDHGVLLDFVTPANDLNWALTPEVDMASLEPSGPHVTLCGIINNMAAASGVTVGVEYVRSASGDVRAKVRRAASAQSIPNNSWTRITFDNVIYDNALMSDDPNDQFVIPETGHYIGMIAVEFAIGAASQSGGVRGAALGLNGSNYWQDTTFQASPAQGVTTVVQTQFEITLNRGDLAYAICNQNSGLSLNVVGFWFSLRRVAQ